MVWFITGIISIIFIYLLLPYYMHQPLHLQACGMHHAASHAAPTWPRLATQCKFADYREGRMP